MNYVIVIRDNDDFGFPAYSPQRYYVAVHSTEDTGPLWNANGGVLGSLLKQAAKYMTDVESGTPRVYSNREVTCLG